MANIFDEHMSDTEESLEGLDELAKFKLFKKIKQTVRAVGKKIKKVGKGVKKVAKSKIGKVVLGVAAVGAASLIAGPFAAGAIGTVANNPKIKKTINNIKKNPEFKQVVKKLKSAGMTEKEIQKVWSESDMYVKTALPVVSNSIVKAIYTEHVSNGMPKDQALALAKKQSQAVATKAVVQEQEKTAGAFKPIYLLPLVALPLLMRK